MELIKRKQRNNNQEVIDKTQLQNMLPLNQILEVDAVMEKSRKACVLD